MSHHGSHLSVDTKLHEGRARGTYALVGPLEPILIESMVHTAPDVTDFLRPEWHAVRFFAGPFLMARPHADGVSQPHACRV